MDGLRTDRAAVNDLDLIERLDITIPFSPTTSEIRYDLRLPNAYFKGLFLKGIPRKDEPGRYWFQVRGSMTKVANNGIHNNDHKDPIEQLYALDDIITSLRLDAFRTLINGLELSVTIPVENAKQICQSIISYLNRPPNYSIMDRDGVRLPYVEMKAGQHRVKMYSPVPGILRFEVNITKMQYLGKDRPKALSDLMMPCYADASAQQLLRAFNRIIWKCPNLKQDDITAEEWNLYQNGRLYEHWQVNKADYDGHTEFKRVEQQRLREKRDFKAIVQHHWPSESPAEIMQHIRQQLYDDTALMNTPLYKTLLDICIKRWEYVGNLPRCNRLPKHLFLPELSEIYPLYIGKYPTSVSTPAYPSPSSQMCVWDSVENFHQQHHKNTEPLVEQKPGSKQVGSKPKGCPQAHAKRLMTIRLSQLEKAIRAPGKLLCPLDEVSPILSAHTRIALACTGQDLNELAASNNHRYRPNKATPLFTE